MINGLAIESDFFHHLTRKSPRKYVDLMAKAKKFIGAEEIFKARETARTIQGGRSKKKGRERVQMPQIEAREISVHP